MVLGREHQRQSPNGTIETKKEGYFQDSPSRESCPEVSSSPFDAFFGAQRLLRVNHHYTDGKSTWSSFFFTSTWLSAIIKRISPREKQWTVVCVILNIAGAILTHVLHTLSFHDPQRVNSLFVRFDPVRSALRLAGYSSIALSKRPTITSNCGLSKLPAELLVTPVGRIHRLGAIGSASWNPSWSG